MSAEVPPTDLEDSMLFHEEVQPDPKLSVFDAKCTAILHRAITKKLRIHHRRWSAHNWQKEFAQLRSEVKSKDRIRTALKWYTIHIGEEFVPIADSAKSFRLKFARIEAAIKRPTKAKWKLIPRKKCSKAVQAILPHLERLKWPKGSKEQLPTMVEHSYQAYEDFMSGIRTLAENPKSSPFIRHLAVCNRRANNFVLEWWQEVFRKVVGWKDWSGRLDSFIPTLDNKRFQEYIRDRADNGGWKIDGLFEELKKCLD